jgi:arylsulfatase A-like enzyme
VDPYIAELMFVDAQVGRLIGALERARLLDRTLVVVVGDHGESLGDHGERDHGVFVYESVLRVPFIVRAPSVAPSRVGAVVRLVDVMPTVLGLLGMEGPRVDGVSLVSLMDGKQSDPGLEAYAESLYPLRLGWSSLASVRDHRFKFIDAPRPELYDLARDPFEEHNIYSDRQSLGEAMRRRVSALSGNRTEVTLPSPELAQRLMALGYVTMSPARPRSDGGELPDPKDCIVVQPSPCHPASR